MTKAWGVRGPVKFDTYKHLRNGVSRIAVCMPTPQGAGSLNILERRHVVIRYLKWRSARHPGPFLSFVRTVLSPSSPPSHFTEIFSFPRAASKGMRLFFHAGHLS
jgi:hypothetical protein